MNAHPPTAYASHVLHRNLRNLPECISRGQGMYLYDQNDKQYLDACGGAAVSCLGHADADVNRAIAKQLAQTAYVHSGFFTSSVTEALADTLIEKAGGSMRAALFVSSGSEAMEAALKMTRQFHLESAQPDRTHIIARQLSYHGTTLGGLAIGGLEKLKAPFKTWLNTDDSSHISPCYAYRYRQEGETEPQFVDRLAAELETEIQRVGPDRVAAFVAETVMGATVGVVPPPPGYFAKIRAVCDRYNVLLVLDEVMCGMGRCGDWFAYHHENIEPDIVCVAKGLGGGFQPIGAMLINDKIFNALSAGSGVFMHGHTYMGHATTCAAAMAVVGKIERLGLIATVRNRGAQMHELLHARFAQHPHIGEIRGRGLFWGMEIVCDRETRSPFPARLGINGKVKYHAMANGLICYPGGGALPDGTGDHVLIAPPFIVSSAQLEEIVERLAVSIDSAIRSASEGA